MMEEVARVGVILEYKIVSYQQTVDLKLIQCYISGCCVVVVVFFFEILDHTQ